MQVYNLEVSKRNEANDNKFEKVGEVAIYYPLLSELGFSVEPEKNDTEGLPVYSDSKHQYVFDAIFSAVKAQARNKLVSGTVQLRDGAKIASTVEELLESGGSSGEAMKVLHEMLKAFKAWLPSTGKSAAVQQAIYDLVYNRRTIALQTEDKKSRLKAYITSFAETLSAEDAARWERHLIALAELCDTADVLDDM